MGLFDKLKGFINDAKDRAVQKQEEEKRRQEEEKRRKEEANRFNPDGKSLQWFSSEDGIKAYNEYITVQNYLLEEALKKEHSKSKYSKEYFEVFVAVVHKDAKLPSIYFDGFVHALHDIEALQRVDPSELLIDILSIQAQPFYIDDNGEPRSKEPYFKPEELISTDKNPTLFFVKNFNCFMLGFNPEGPEIKAKKFTMWSDILIWLARYGGLNKEIISENPWIFSHETYFNDSDTFRTLKEFYKKCAELASKEEYKIYFEELYNECKNVNMNIYRR